MLGRRSLPLLLALLLCALLARFPRTAEAHGILLRSDPPAGATLDRSPARITLYFNEDMEREFSGFELLDSAGKKIPGLQGTPSPSNRTIMELAVPELKRGIYTVSWRMLSSVDGHSTRGSFAFGIGEEVSDAGSAVDQASALTPQNVVARWLGLLAGALLLGGFVYRLLVWLPATAGLARASKNDAAEARFAQILRGAWTGFAVAAALALVAQAAEAANLPFWRGFSIFAIADVLRGTRFGTIWLARLVLTVLLGFLLWDRRLSLSRSAPLWGGTLLSALALLTISLNSHGAALDPASGLVDWAHTLAMGVWLGGLVQLVLTLPLVLDRLREPARGRVLATTVSRFSGVALPAVGALVLTGGYNAIVQIGAPVALTDTLYGRALLVKLALFLPMLLFAAANLLWVSPRLSRLVRLEQATEAFRRHFRLFVGAEAALGLLVLASVGVLTNLSPPRDLAATGLFARPINQVSEAGDLRLALSVTPGRPGVNDIVVRLRGRDLQPYTRPAEVLITARVIDQSLGESSFTLAPSGPGVYSVHGPYISVPGTWQLAVTVRQSGLADASTAFRFAAPDTAGVTAATPATFLNGLTLAGLIFLTLAYYAAAGLVRRQPRGERLARGAVALGLLILSLTLAYWGGARGATSAAAAQINPFPPDSASLTRGQQVYTTHCLSCHGANANGLGPNAPKPPPPDLNVHVPFHPDSDLYNWISDGVPDKGMPAFRNTLSEADRWHVLNYLHALADANQH